MSKKNNLGDISYQKIFLHQKKMFYRLFVIYCFEKFPVVITMNLCLFKVLVIGKWEHSHSNVLSTMTLVKISMVVIIVENVEICKSKMGELILLECMQCSQLFL